MLYVFMIILGLAFSVYDYSCYKKHFPEMTVYEYVFMKDNFVINSK